MEYSKKEKDFLLQAQRLREHLAQMDDGPRADGKYSINKLADNFEVDRTSLIDFRNGNDGALSRSLVKAWGQQIGASAVMIGNNIEDPFDIFTKQYQEEDQRVSRYDLYDSMEATRGEAESALHCWSDMACTGSVTEEHRSTGGFVPNSINGDTADQKLLTDSARRLYQTVLSPGTLHSIVRDMAKYGSWFEQPGIEQVGRELNITRLETMDNRRLRVLDNPTPDRTYGWFLPGRLEPEVTFPGWKIVHFANLRSRADTYGTSVLQSSLRAYVQVEAMEAGMIIRRLERASLRNKWTVDTSHCADADEAYNEVRKWEKTYQRTQTIDGSRNFQSQKITMPPTKDLWLGKKSSDSPADVEVLQGDANLDQIADFSHFFNKYLAGLGPPKHLLGYEQDTMRSVSTDLTIAFARKARRFQMHCARGISHLIWLDLMIHGIDPRTVPFLIVPPTMGTRDELIRAQVMMTHATVCQYLSKAMSTTGQVPSPAWFMKYIMGFDEECISQMNLQAVVQQPTGQSSDPAMNPKENQEMLNHLTKDQELAADIRMTKHLANERLIAFADPSFLVERGIMTPGDFVPQFNVTESARHMRLTLRDARAA